MSWYKYWFADELYIHLYAHRDSTEARQAIDLFQSVTSLRPGDAPLLDLACGTGRHAFELARRGYRIVAADLSRTLLAEALRKTRKFASSLQIVRADMRHLPLTDSLGAVLQLFTAFGYFASDEENWAVLGEVRRALRSGGWYMLDFLNAGEVMSALQPLSTQILGDAVIAQERQIEAGRVEKRITITRGGQVQEFRESVRLFTLGDFRRMFPAYGLTLEHVFGDYDGSPYNDQSPRCLMFARAQ